MHNLGPADVQVVYLCLLRDSLNKYSHPVSAAHFYVQGSCRRSPIKRLLRVEKPLKVFKSPCEWAQSQRWDEWRILAVLAESLCGQLMGAALISMLSSISKKACGMSKTAHMCNCRSCSISAGTSREASSEKVLVHSSAVCAYSNHARNCVQTRSPLTLHRVRPAVRSAPLR
ncbi:hypothetical protein B0H34DRAFT_135369 [Crassisporium funariophilum]|nr:hypothetical protein B0H34DRAFT_135369 [Crassisporium funariophilum]